jgi:CBS domain containing-hemolysin-like protein
MQPVQHFAERVSLESPALEVMTDLRRMTAVLVRASDTVAHAHERMRARGVRMLLCVDIQGRLEGLITLTDILGEKPVQAAQARGVSNADLLVRDIMTPLAKIEAFRLEDVASARVGHVVASLKRVGRQHALVVDLPDGQSLSVCGVFSATQIARQLGVQIQTTEVAQTFAEIEALLVR